MRTSAALASGFEFHLEPILTGAIDGTACGLQPGCELGQTRGAIAKVNDMEAGGIAEGPDRSHLHKNCDVRVAAEGASRLEEHVGTGWPVRFFS